MKALVLFVGIIGVLIGCAKSTIKPGKEFELKYGKTADLNVSGSNDLEIKFADITEESRCAPGLQCIWAGRVAVELKLNGNNSAILGLNHEEHPEQVSFEEWNIRLIEVIYDSDEDFGNKEKSRLKLVVEK